MAHLAKKLINLLKVIGVDVPAMARFLSAIPRFLSDLLDYHRASRGGRFPLRLRFLKPLLTDMGQPAGQAQGHHFHQDLWAARKIYVARPERHVDVVSRTDGFVAHVLSLVFVDVIDIRPLECGVEGLTVVKADATELAGIPDNRVQSLSSLHAVENFGLGRYGGRICPDACFMGMRALARILAPRGRLYFSVPVGTERLEFNAHRVFSPRTILRTFSYLRLLSFSAVDEDGRFQPDVEPSDFETARLACELFEFTKEAADRADTG